LYSSASQKGTSDGLWWAQRWGFGFHKRREVP